VDYTQAIISEATAAGIEPAVALAVAHRESGTQQYWQDGRLKVSNKGAIGIMQVLPSTAPGVNLADPAQNIKAGVGELARLHAAFGNWPLALAGYNWGEGRVRDAQAGRRKVPAEVLNYVTGVLGPDQLTSVSAATVTAKKHPSALAFGIFAAGIALVVALR
jgi:soluble lytic murein transglycosylase-like protein